MVVPSGVTPPPIISAMRAGDHHAGQVGVERGMGALHRAFGAFAAELFFGQAGDDDRQLVRRQRVGVVQHAGDRQVLAAHRAVDDDLQALDRGEHVHRAPVAAGTVVVDDVVERSHQIISSALRFFSSLMTWRRVSARNSGCAVAARLPTRRTWSPPPTSPKNSRICSKRALLAMRGVDHLRQRAGTHRAHQRPRRDQVGEVQRRDRALLGGLHHRRGADRQVGLELAHRGDVLLERGAVLHVHAVRLQPLAGRARSTASSGRRCRHSGTSAPLSISSRATSSSEPS